YDASDGAVEGHYTDWVLDGTSNKKLPSEAFGVGTCGAHTLAFNTHYGPYTGSGSTPTSTTDLPLSISPFKYLARPYVVAVQGASCSGGAAADAESNELNGPDPVIVKLGCLTVGSPCSFTVTSAKNPTLAGWSCAWSSNTAVTNSGTNTSEFKPQFTTTTD